MDYKRKKGASSSSSGSTISGQSKWLAPMLNAGFAAGATALGAGALAPAAGMVGSYLGQKIKDITGYGDYVVNKNSLLSGTVPSLGNPSRFPNGTTISHKEMVGDVISGANAGEFSIYGFDLNPNNAQLWEWLTQIACNYEEWVPEGIVFYFKSTSSDSLSSTNTSLGTVIMATNYNVYNAPFTTKAEMTNYEYCTIGRPSCDMMHMIECDPHQGSISTYYTSSVNTAGNEGKMDKRFNTLGTFYIATAGMQAGYVNLGELWVTYQVTLLKPKLYESLGLANDFLRVTTALVAASNTAAGLMPGAGATYSSSSTIPFSGYQTETGKFYIVSNSSNSVTWFWPCYAYPTKYTVLLTTHSDAVVDTPSFALTQSNNGYGNRYTPVATNTLWSPDTSIAGTVDVSYSFDVVIPGGFIPTMSNGVLKQVTTQLVWTFSAGAMTNYYAKLQIMQIPYFPKELSYAVPT